MIVQDEPGHGRGCLRKIDASSASHSAQNGRDMEQRSCNRIGQLLGSCGTCKNHGQICHRSQEEMACRRESVRASISSYWTLGTVGKQLDCESHIIDQIYTQKYEFGSSVNIHCSDRTSRDEGNREQTGEMWQPLKSERIL
jgi:hypothetical protein